MPGDIFLQPCQYYMTTFAQALAIIHGVETGVLPDTPVTLQVPKGFSQWSTQPPYANWKITIYGAPVRGAERPPDPEDYEYCHECQLKRGGKLKFSGTKEVTLDVCEMCRKEKPLIPNDDYDYERKTQ